MKAGESWAPMAPISAPASVSPSPLGAPSPQAQVSELGLVLVGFDSKLSTQDMAYHSGPADPVQLSLPLSFAHEHSAADLQGLCTGHPPPPDFRVTEFPSLSLWGHCGTVLTPKLDCNLLVL